MLCVLVTVVDQCMSICSWPLFPVAVWPEQWIQMSFLLLKALDFDDSIFYELWQVIPETLFIFCAHRLTTGQKESNNDIVKCQATNCDMLEWPKTVYYLVFVLQKLGHQSPIIPTIKDGEHLSFAFIRGSNMRSFHTKASEPEEYCEWIDNPIQIYQFQY